MGRKSKEEEATPIPPTVATDLAVTYPKKEMVCRILQWIGECNHNNVLRIMSPELISTSALALHAKLRTVLIKNRVVYEYQLSESLEIQPELPFDEEDFLTVGPKTSSEDSSFDNVINLIGDVIKLEEESESEDTDIEAEVEADSESSFVIG